MTEPLVIGYENWRGEYAIRRIIPLRAPYWGNTEWHPESQWLLDAIDADTGKERTFAMRDMHHRDEKVGQPLTR